MYMYTLWGWVVSTTISPFAALVGKYAQQKSIYPLGPLKQLLRTTRK